MIGSDNIGNSWIMLFMNMYAHVSHVGCLKICMTHLGHNCMAMYATEPLPLLSLPQFAIDNLRWVSEPTTTLTFDVTSPYLCTLGVPSPTCTHEDMVLCTLIIFSGLQVSITVL